MNKNKFKRYWKLLLENESDLNSVEYKRYTCFNKYMSELDIVEYLLSIDKELAIGYDFYQSILSSVRNRDVSILTETIHNEKYAQELPP